ncbi:RNA polymerase subunit sigma-70 [Nibricoccus aquaticus]|uniref:RNA polymerase subunit sigma-70 n=1 Tax=Nibricoccus aquaticus TaxID=2576891 RepID=A0A290Q7F0_9BACT|nr:sigma-70 family RNA polymerase sigma factor [Nibricoccus aquaticus]ATC64333.1 RNA polymerase subunit sigma-70 [Nibricoccus aquaticus]
MSASFATTRWTLVLAAHDSDALKSEAALAELCHTYWQPLYAHARRHPLPPADAEDAVQGFFARLLRLESLADAERTRGRFRAFLLGSFNHYLADLRDHARAEKRGAHLLTPLDTQAAETAFAQTPSSDLPPDRAFDRAWALALLARVTTSLRDEHIATNRTALFDALSPHLAGRRADIAHADLAAKLNMTEPAIRVALHRLRQRYRQLLRAEIAHTVARDSDIDDELRLLLASLAL